MKIKVEIPKHWKANLEKLKTKGFKAAIAGGALRDLACGKKPKDIDYWVFNATFYREVLGVLSDLDEDVSVDNEWSSRGYDQISPTYQITYVAQQRGRKVPIQVIGLVGVNSVMDLISKFDFGLNQIGYFNGKLYHTDLFAKDFKNHTFTLTQTLTYRKSLERFASWTENKYRGWTYDAVGAVKRYEFIESFKTKEQKSKEPVA